MTNLADHLLELAPLLVSLEAAVATGGEIPSASPAQLFEWRIRARILEDKLYQAAKPPGREKSEEEKATERGAPPPVFSEQAAGQARLALPKATALREALQNKRLKVALDAAWMVARAVA